MYSQWIFLRDSLYAAHACSNVGMLYMQFCLKWYTPLSSLNSAFGSTKHAVGPVDPVDAVVAETALPFISVNPVSGHVEHAVAPPVEYVFCAHGPVGVDNPVVAQYEPAGHGVASDVPPVHIEPIGQIIHVLGVSG